MGGERAVLVHGLWVHAVLMEVQRRLLARAGFDAVSWSYSSVRTTLTENAARLARFAHSLAVPVVHWVGHSLGGLVILHMLEQEQALPPGRVVLQGVPSRGSHPGRVLARNALGARVLGRSMREWLEREHPERYPGREIGIIAGSRGLGLGRLLIRGMPAPGDGVVAVAETMLDGATDSIVLPVSHSGMLFSRAIARQTAAFLRDGRFDHATR